MVSAPLTCPYCGDMTTLTGQRVVELTTTVRFDRSAFPDLALAAQSLEETLVAKIHEESIPTLKQYFVRVVGDAVEVGLRFKGMDPTYVSGAADDVLNGALELMGVRPNLRKSSAKRTSTTLVGA